MRTAFVAASAVFAELSDKRKMEYLENIVSEALKMIWNRAEHKIHNHDKLIGACNKLEGFPEMGAPVPDSKLATLEFRMIPIGNYIVFYRVYYANQEVTILRILDSRRDYPRFFKNYIERDNE